MNVPRSISQPRETISLSHKVERANCYYEYFSFFKLTTQNNFALAQSRNALIVIMNVPKTISLLQSKKRASSYYEYSSYYKLTKQNNFAFRQTK